MTKCLFFAPNEKPFTIMLKNIPSIGDEVIFTINERSSMGPEFFCGKVYRRVFRNNSVHLYTDGAW